MGRRGQSRQTFQKEIKGKNGGGISFLLRVMSEHEQQQQQEKILKKKMIDFIYIVLLKFWSFIHAEISTAYVLTSHVDAIQIG